MIGRLAAWFGRTYRSALATWGDFREFGGFELAVFGAVAVGVGTEEIEEATRHPELRGTGTYRTATVVVRCLSYLASVGVPYGIRLQVLVGMVLRYRECFGPGVMPDLLLHNCARALATVMGKGRVPRQDFCQFVEAFPQFHKGLGRDPRSGDVLNWFERAGGPDASATIRLLDN